jgi:O-antigen ligase
VGSGAKVPVAKSFTIAARDDQGVMTTAVIDANMFNTLNGSGTVEVKAHSEMGDEQRYSTVIYRLLTWRDMIRELIQNKALLGFDFGKPLRSESIEITGMAYGEWSRDGWIATHNSYLEAIYRTGIIGVCLVILLFVYVARLAGVFVRKRFFAGSCFMGIIMYWMATAFVYVTFEMPYSAITFWTIFGIAWAYAKKTKTVTIAETASRMRQESKKQEVRS